jgi:hypothetical protein
MIMLLQRSPISFAQGVRESFFGQATLHVVDRARKRLATLSRIICMNALLELNLLLLPVLAGR